MKKLIEIINPLNEKKLEIKTLVVLVSIPASLTLMQFCGKSVAFRILFGNFLSGYSPDVVNLLYYIYWSSFCGFCYVVIPSLITWFVLRGSVLQYGLKVYGITKHLWVYVTLYLIMIPFIIFASLGKSFQFTYPFYKQSGSDWMLFVIFEFFYLIQFFYLELFFRGYIIFNLEKTFGYYSVFIMTIPYCMIHFSKPMLEAFAAIVAGIILGTLALRTRSIWYGVLIHMSVAVTMDILSLLQKHQLF